MNLNQHSCDILRTLERQKSVQTTKLALPQGNATILDLGVNARPAKTDGLRMGVIAAQASTGGLADITPSANTLRVSIPRNVALATLGSQMAGWAIPTGNGCAMASGPARILARKPKSIFQRIRYTEESPKTALILETDRLPDKKTLEYIANETKASDITIAAFKGNTHAGLINVLARVVELAVYRLDFLGYDVNSILSAKGTVPIPKTMDMCEANDAVIYHSRVKLEVTEWDNTLTEKCTSKTAACYGKKFKEIYQQAGCDFYKIDPAIYAPARVEIKVR